MREKRFRQHPRHKHISCDTKHGVWYYVEYIPGHGTIKKSLKTKSVAEALDRAQEKRAEAYAKKPEELKRLELGVKNPSIESLYKEFKQFKETSGKIKDQSLVRIDNTWDYHLSEYWGKKTLDDWTHKEILKFETWYLKERSDKVYFNIKKTLVSFQRWMFQEKYISEAYPLEDLDEILKKMQRREKVGRVYSALEIRSMIECAPDDLSRLGILIGAQMGCRKMEILKLKRDEIVFDESEQEWIAKVWSDKNGKFRDIGLPPEVEKLLFEVLKSHDSEWVFPMRSDRSRHMSSQVFDKGWVTAKKNAVIRDWDRPGRARFHDLRHTFATMTAEQGWPPKLACEILDMSLKRYDQVYTHVSRSAKIKRMRGVSLNDY